MRDPRSMAVRTAFAAAVLTTTFVAALWGQRSANITADALRRAGTASDARPGEWVTYGKNQSETRYSTLKEINAGNAKDLGLAWTYVMGAGGGNQEGTPLFWNNTLYGITTWSVVFALDGRTGKEIWRWDPQVDQPKVRPSICCGNVNRGIALYEGTIIAPSIDGRLFALDARTGKPLWDTRIVDSKDLYTITMAPRIAGGKVIIGAAGRDKPTRGQFVALDAKTGQLAWRFYTVPGDPSKPFENEAMAMAAKTWHGEWWKLGGGGTVWESISYDPELNLIYFGTSNGTEWNQAYRSAGQGDNLFLSSIVAVNADTGAYVWHYQATPGEEWDYDAVQQLILADLSIDGTQRQVLMQANKNGFFYVLDRKDRPADLRGRFHAGHLGERRRSED